MKDIGKVKEYNKYHGEIINESGDSYLLMNEEIYDNKSIKESDLVSFVPEAYEKNGVNKKVARFVKKLDINK